MEATDAANDVTDPWQDSAFRHRVLRHAEGVAWVLVEEEVVVHHVDSSTTFVLNPHAGLVWRCFDGQSSLHEIVDDIADIYEVDVEQLFADVGPVVADWVESGIAEVVDQP